MNEYNEMIKQMNEMVKEVDELRTLLIESSPLNTQREEYYKLVDQIQFLMEELVIFEDEEEIF